MEALVNTVLLISTGVLVCSDLRYRSVSLLWLGVFGGGGLLYALLVLPIFGIVYNSLINILLLGWVIGGIWLYLRLRYRKFKRPFTQYLGAGDLLFMLLIIPQVSCVQYLILLLGGSVIGLIYWSIIWMVSRRVVTIPLVSAIGSIFIVQLCYRIYVNWL